MVADARDVALAGGDGGDAAAGGRAGEGAGGTVPMPGSLTDQPSVGVKSCGVAVGEVAGGGELLRRERAPPPVVMSVTVDGVTSIEVSMRAAGAAVAAVRRRCAPPGPQPTSGEGAQIRLRIINESAAHAARSAKGEPA